MFELSKVELAAIPPRLIANLRNVDEGLAKRVADGLNIALPPKAKPVRPPIDMPPSPALSIPPEYEGDAQGGGWSAC